MTSPFDHPEAAEILESLLVGLTHESPRGAALIGCAKVEDCTEGLLDAVIPREMGKKRRRELFRYPGAFSSFAAKIEIAYSTRLIQRSIYDALHALKALRNKAAHSPNTFSLRGREREYMALYVPLGPNLDHGVRHLALEAMFRNKTAAIKEALERAHLQMGDPPPNEDDAKKWFLKAAKDPDIVEAMNDQLPHWELTIGLGLLCAMILTARDTAVAVFSEHETVFALGKGRETPAPQKKAPKRKRRSPK